MIMFCQFDSESSDFDAKDAQVFQNRSERGWSCDKMLIMCNNFPKLNHFS